MYTDYHCHLLPGMDDGSENLVTSKSMLLLLQQQGIRQVIATSHYYRHRESIDSFLARRQVAYEQLLPAIPEGLTLTLGAEIRLERDLYQQTDLSELSLGDSGGILLEFPYGESYRDWMGEEVYNITCTHRLRPVLAHVERYLQWYSSRQMEEVLAIPDAVIQFNCESLRDRKALKFILSILKSGRPVVFGTDSHNMTSRPPNMNLFFSVLRKKLSPDQWERQLRWNSGEF